MTYDLKRMIIESQIANLPKKQPQDYLPVLPNISHLISSQPNTLENFKTDLQTINNIFNTMGNLDDITAQHSVGLQKLIQQVQQNLQNLDFEQTLVDDLFIQIATLFHDTGKLGLESITNSKMILHLEYQDIVKKADELSQKYQPLKSSYESLLTAMFSCVLPAEISGFNTQIIQKNGQSLNSVRYQNESSFSVAHQMAIHFLQLIQQACLDDKEESKKFFAPLLQKFPHPIRQEILKHLSQESLKNLEVLEDIKSAKKLLISHYRKMIEIHPIEGWKRFVQALHKIQQPLSKNATAHLFGGIVMHHNPFGSSYGYPSKDVIQNLKIETFTKVDEKTEEVISQSARWVNIWDIIHALCYDKRSYISRKDLETFINSFTQDLQKSPDEISKMHVDFLTDPNFIEQLKTFLPQHDDFISKMNLLPKRVINGVAYFNMADVINFSKIR